MNELNVNIMNDFSIQMSLQLISIPGCNSRSWTIAAWPFSEAKIKGVSFNIRIQFPKLSKTEI